MQNRTPIATGRRFLVTGGAGFLGSHVCARLLAAGVAVVCVDNFSTGRARNIEPHLSEPGFEFVEADVTAGIPVSGPFDAVLHLASPASPADYLRLPVETLEAGSTGTRHALDIARRDGARFLFTSSSEVYGDPLLHPQPEEYWGNVNPIGPRSVYDEAKRYGEALIAAYRRRHGVETRIARLFNTYGPGMRDDDGRIVPTFVSQALRGEPITVHGDGTQTRTLCHVDDTVTGLLALLASAVPGPVNIGGVTELSVLRIAELVRTLADSDSPIVHVPSFEDDPQVRRPDLTLARAALGWSPDVPVEVGLAEVVAWMRGEWAGVRPPISRDRGRLWN
ncbi:MAG TPA: UDP-glucuronic acid decarboxylase family protein [Actinospica sp.]|nr:UDP-glucuronic acid decarboxylase family protein [Actinospica sp.]